MPVGWLMVGAAVVLAAAGIFFYDKHDFGKRDERMMLVTVTNDDNKLGALAMIACIGAAAVLFFYGKNLL